MSFGWARRSPCGRVRRSGPDPTDSRGGAQKTAEGCRCSRVSNRWRTGGFGCRGTCETARITCSSSSLPLMPGTYLLDLYFGDFGDTDARPRRRSAEASRLKWRPPTVGYGALPAGEPRIRCSGTQLGTVSPDQAKSDPAARYLNYGNKAVQRVLFRTASRTARYESSERVRRSAVARARERHQRGGQGCGQWNEAAGVRRARGTRACAASMAIYVNTLPDAD